MLLSSQRPTHIGENEYHMGRMNLSFSEEQIGRDRDSTMNEDAKLVWVTNMLMQTDNLFGFSAESTQGDPKEYLRNIYKYQVGDEVPPGFLPDIMWSNDAEDDRRKNLPDFFRANDFLIISRKFADVLRQFDYGDSEIIPVRLVHSDQESPYPGDHQLLYLREAKEAFEPDYSSRFRRPRMEGQAHLGSMSGIPADGDISVNPSATDGADLWQDPRLLKSIFFSDRLMRALLEQNLLGGVKYFRCPVVSHI